MFDFRNDAVEVLVNFEDFINTVSCGDGSFRSLLSFVNKWLNILWNRLSGDFFGLSSLLIMYNSGDFLALVADSGDDFIANSVHGDLSWSDILHILVDLADFLNDVSQCLIFFNSFLNDSCGVHSLHNLIINSDWLSLIGNINLLIGNNCDFIIVLFVNNCNDDLIFIRLFR